MRLWASSRNSTARTFNLHPSRCSCFSGGAAPKAVPMKTLFALCFLTAILLAPQAGLAADADGQAVIRAGSVPSKVVGSENFTAASARTKALKAARPRGITGRPSPSSPASAPPGISTPSARRSSSLPGAASPRSGERSPLSSCRATLSFALPAYDTGTARPRIRP